MSSFGLGFEPTSDEARTAVLVRGDAFTARDRNTSDQEKSTAIAESSGMRR